MADTSKWVELSVEADAESVESVADLFSQVGHNQGVVIEEPYRQDEDGEQFAIDPERPVIVRTFVAEENISDEVKRTLREGIWHLRQLGGVGDLEEEVRVEEDWANAWKQHFPVLRIGKNFVVRPSWLDYEAKPDDLVIDIDPGMAFGTGSHPSTEMCVQFMEEIDFQNKTALDAGAGSGILSVAAILRGARQVVAVEIDPYAARSLDENIALNTMSDRIETIVGPVGNVVEEGRSFDIVIANIIARILIENAEVLAARMARSGIMLASGIIQQREGQVVEAFQTQDLKVVARRESGDWVTLMLEKVNS